jgi:ABC-type sugar transport system ATPase subunit
MIRVENLSCEAGAFRLEAISFAVPAASYAVLMGATGCGKTTLLELLCGLRTPSEGRIYLGEEDVTFAPPGRRGIGYVPQDGALFPTYRVRDQIGFALKLRRRPAAEITARVESLAAQLGVASLLGRLPQALSGGERQRVALARALAAEPAVLLLDEPLSALDEDRRDEIATLLRATQQRLGLTVLHVTHSRQEALQVADRCYRLDAGALREVPLPR